MGLHAAPEASLHASRPFRFASVLAPSHTDSLRTRPLRRLHGLPLSGKGGGEVTHRMFLVTGGAGFIGSNVVASLNEAGHSDIVVNDTLDTGAKVAQSRQATTCRCGAARRAARLA